MEAPHSEVEEGEVEDINPAPRSPLPQQGRPSGSFIPQGRMDPPGEFTVRGISGSGGGGGGGPSFPNRPQNGGHSNGNGAQSAQRPKLAFAFNVKNAAAKDQGRAGPRPGGGDRPQPPTYNNAPVPPHSNAPGPVKPPSSASPQLSYDSPPPAKPSALFEKASAIKIALKGSTSLPAKPPVASGASSSASLTHADSREGASSLPSRPLAFSDRVEQFQASVEREHSSEKERSAPSGGFDLDLALGAEPSRSFADRIAKQEGADSSTRSSKPDQEERIPSSPLGEGQLRELARRESKGENGHSSRRRSSHGGPSTSGRRHEGSSGNHRDSHRDGSERRRRSRSRSRSRSREPREPRERTSTRESNKDSRKASGSSRHDSETPEQRASRKAKERQRDGERDVPHNRSDSHRSVSHRNDDDEADNPVKKRPRVDSSKSKREGSTPPRPARTRDNSDAEEPPAAGSAGARSRQVPSRSPPSDLDPSSSANSPVRVAVPARPKRELTRTPPPRDSRPSNSGKEPSDGRNRDAPRTSSSNTSHEPRDDRRHDRRRSRSRSPRRDRDSHRGGHRNDWDDRDDRGEFRRDYPHQSRSQPQSSHWDDDRSGHPLHTRTRSPPRFGGQDSYYPNHRGASSASGYRPGGDRNQHHDRRDDVLNYDAVPSDVSALYPDRPFPGRPIDFPTKSKAIPEEAEEKDAPKEPPALEKRAPVTLAFKPPTAAIPVQPRADLLEGVPTGPKASSLPARPAPPTGGDTPPRPPGHVPTGPRDRAPLPPQSFLPNPPQPQSFGANNQHQYHSQHAQHHAQYPQQHPQHYPQGYPQPPPSFPNNNSGWNGPQGHPGYNQGPYVDQRQVPWVDQSQGRNFDQQQRPPPPPLVEPLFVEPSLPRPAPIHAPLRPSISAEPSRNSTPHHPNSSSSGPPPTDPGPRNLPQQSRRSSSKRGNLGANGALFVQKVGIAQTPYEPASEETPAHVYVGSSKVGIAYDMGDKVGEGTFGIVRRAVRTAATAGKAVAGGVYALKEIILHNESDGMPITSLREIRILKSLDHPNVVPVVDIAYLEGDHKTFQLGKTFMVFPYMEHDLAGLLENKEVNLTEPIIKQYSKQLLMGTHYLHKNKILHRDMKAANLLINNKGILMIADFGLARSIHKIEAGREYTNCVVTRWYRPPELLLGERKYHTSVDMWGVACVIAEMFQKKPLFQGESDLNQAQKIFEMCGSPTNATMPGFSKLPGCDGVNSWKQSFGVLKQKCALLCGQPAFGDFIGQILLLNPRERLTAAQALDHEWFWSDPVPTEPCNIPDFSSSHELDRRTREEAETHANLLKQQNQPYTSSQQQQQFQQQDQQRKVSAWAGQSSGTGAPSNQFNGQQPRLDNRNLHNTNYGNYNGNFNGPPNGGGGGGYGNNHNGHRGGQGPNGDYRGPNQGGYQGGGEQNGGFHGGSNGNHQGSYGQNGPPPPAKVNLLTMGARPVAAGRVNRVGYGKPAPPSGPSASAPPADSRKPPGSYE